MSMSARFVTSERRDEYGPHPSEEYRPHPMHYDDWVNELEALGELQGRVLPDESDLWDYHQGGLSPQETIDRFHNL